jgi:hypothetical protein
LLTEKINPDAEKVVSSYKVQVSSASAAQVAKLETASIGNPQPATENQ